MTVFGNAVVSVFIELFVEVPEFLEQEKSKMDKTNIIKKNFH